MYRAICYLLVGVFWNLALFLHSNALSAQLSGIVLSFCWLDWVLSFECGQPLWSVLWMGSHRWKLVLISSSLNLPQKQEIPCLMCEFCLFFFWSATRTYSVSVVILSAILSASFYLLISKVKLYHLPNVPIPLILVVLKLLKKDSCLS